MCVRASGTCTSFGQATKRKARGMLITLSGLDGAGKSTLIASLRTALEERQRPVAVLHLDDDVGVYAYARMVRDRLKGPMKPAGAPSNGDRTPANPGATSPGRIILRRAWDAIVWSKVLRRLIYPVDLLLFLCYRAYIEGIRKRVLIMDRYFYDTLVDVADGRGWGWIRFLKLITPTLTLPCWWMPAPSSRTRARASTPSNTCGVAGRRTKRSSRGSVLPSGFATTTSRPHRPPSARSRSRDSTPREPRDGASARLLGAAAAGGRKHRGACAGPPRLGSAPRSHASERRAGAHRGTPRDAGRSNPRAFRRSRGQRAGASALYARAGPAGEPGLRSARHHIRISEAASGLSGHGRRRRPAAARALRSGGRPDRRRLASLARRS